MNMSSISGPSRGFGSTAILLSVLAAALIGVAVVLYFVTGDIGPLTGGGDATQPTATSTAASEVDTDDPAGPNAAPAAPPVGAGGLTAAEQGLPPELAPLEQIWTGDLDRLVDRRVIRVLTVFAKGIYFLDGADQRGVTYELVKMFEEELNETLDTGNLRIHVVVIPVTRDRLIPSLIEGRGDIAAANLTVTAERLELVDFSNPFLTGVDEIVVSGPTAPPVTRLEDLAGQTIHVRPSSSYYTSLVRLNESLRATGRPEVELVEAAEYLEDEDLLEMVNGGLIPLVVVDGHKGQFWAQIFEDIRLHPDVAVATGGEIAWAFRRDSPQLREALDRFVAGHRQGSLMGNIVLKRYLNNTDWVENSLNATELERFQQMEGLFRRYAGEYDFDWLMVAAQGYQESRLDQSVRSRVGAVGVMQLLPSTAADPNVGIPDIEILENNIHAGAKYLRFLLDRYFADQAMDRLNQGLFAFAAYNAGPARVARLRDEAELVGLDPNVWFDNVEVIAAKRIGSETVQYVSNIYKYYLAYRMIAGTLDLREEASVPARP